MTIKLTDDQQKAFDKWIPQFIKESGFNFVAGDYIILKESPDFITYRCDPRYYEWYERKKEQFLNETNKLINMDLKFRVYYDQRVDEVVDMISERLEQFGLKINWIQAENDGFDDYEIVKNQIN